MSKRLCWVARELSPVRNTGEGNEKAIQSYVADPQYNKARHVVDSLILYARDRKRHVTPKRVVEDEKNLPDCSADNKSINPFHNSEAAEDCGSFGRVEVEKYSTNDTHSLTVVSCRKVLGKDEVYSLSEEKEWTVEAILKERNSKKNGREYLVKWLGYDKPSDNTWEPYQTVMDLEALDRYEKWKEEKKYDRSRLRQRSGNQK